MTESRRPIIATELNGRSKWHNEFLNDNKNGQACNPRPYLEIQHGKLQLRVRQHFSERGAGVRVEVAVRQV